MDFRPFLAGILPAVCSCLGAFALTLAAGYSLMAFLALLILILPVIALLSYLLQEVRALEHLIRQQSRQVTVSVHEQAAAMKRQYGETMDQVLELNTELRRRVYR